MVISIVVPVYKVEAYLNRCVDSILAQTFTDFELILVDDGSPDNCGKICDEYAEKDKRIKVIHQENGGLSAARNAGIEIAQGEWITFIDSDDWIHPSYLRVLYEAVTANGADVSVGRYKEVYDEDVDNGAINPDITMVNTEEFWVNNRTNATVAWGKLYKRSFFDELRYPLRKIDEDEYTTYKVLFKNKDIALVNVAIYWYYQNPNSISRMNYISVMDDVTQSFYEQYCYFKDSEFKKAYLMSIENYADSISQGIWKMKADRSGQYAEKLEKERNRLKAFLAEHRGEIAFEKNKAIFISAYPGHELFIRGFGFIKQKLKNER